MTNDELPLAIYYAELGSPTKGGGAVGLAVAQARADERAKLAEILMSPCKHYPEPPMGKVPHYLKNARRLDCSECRAEIIEALKSGQMPAAATKIGFERIKGMPPFYGRGKDSLKQKPIIRSSGQEVKLTKREGRQRR